MGEFMVLLNTSGKNKYNRIGMKIYTVPKTNITTIELYIRKQIIESFGWIKGNKLEVAFDMEDKRIRIRQVDSVEKRGYSIQRISNSFFIKFRPPSKNFPKELLMVNIDEADFMIDSLEKTIIIKYKNYF